MILVVAFNSNMQENCMLAISSEKQVVNKCLR